MFLIFVLWIYLIRVLHLRNIWRILINICHTRGGADKSLARPGRRKSTAIKLGIFSTYSPRTSIHFLARCSNLCTPLKKKIRMFSVLPGLRGSNDLRVGRKMTNFQSFFQSREQMVVLLGQIRRIGWVIKKMEAQLGQFLLRCKFPLRRGIVVQEQDTLGELSAAFVLQNVLQLHQQRWVILRFDSLALWKMINEEYAVLIPKNRGENFSSGFLHSEFFRRDPNYFLSRLMTMDETLLYHYDPETQQ